MSSQRHTEVAAAAVAPELPPAVLAATRDAVLAVGVRRATLTDVARRAGVSRMTLYRLAPDVASLVLAMLTAEFQAVVAAAERAVARRRTARARLVAVVLEIVRRLPADPVFTRIVDVDPELLLPYVVDRFGGTQQIALGHLRRGVTEGHADGSVRRGDADAQATLLLLLATPFILGARPLEAAGAREAVLKELGIVLDRALRP